MIAISAGDGAWRHGMDGSTDVTSCWWRWRPFPGLQLIKQRWLLPSEAQMVCLGLPVHRRHLRLVLPILVAQHVWLHLDPRSGTLWCRGQADAGREL